MFTLISQYQEVLPENRSDFYRFLYNRSKIKPLTYYFQSNSESPSKATSFEDKKSPEEKSQFNFDFQQHASKAKLKEDGLKDKIGKWLEEIENNADPVDDPGERQGTSSEEGKMEIESKKRDATEVYNIHKIEPNEIVLPNTKVKQKFGELFGDKKINVFAQKKISALDTFDKLLLEPTIETTPEKESVDALMDVDGKVHNKNENLTEVEPECSQKCIKSSNSK